MRRPDATYIQGLLDRLGSLDLANCLAAIQDGRTIILRNEDIRSSESDMAGVSDRGMTIVDFLICAKALNCDRVDTNFRVEMQLADTKPLLGTLPSYTISARAVDAPEDPGSLLVARGRTRILQRPGKGSALYCAVVFCRQPSTYTFPVRTSIRGLRLELPVSLLLKGLLLLV